MGSPGHGRPARVDVLAELDGDPATRGWLAALQAVGPPPFDVALPTADELPPLLLWLAVPHEDIGDLLALLPRDDLPGDRHDPELRWLLERAVHLLWRATGPDDDALDVPRLPAGLGPLGRYLPALVVLAMLPHTLRLHRERGVEPEVSRLSLADLGRHLARHRLAFGTGGVEHPGWLTRHLQGKLFQLGRLQFERLHLRGRVAEAVRDAGIARAEGAPALSVHIPGLYGPMSPQACDTSFALAGSSFARHFPQDRFEVAVCDSWLLDPQLAEYLPPGSNILRFARRFQVAHPAGDLDGAVQDFVFGRRYPAPEAMPAATTLERAVAAHARAGRHWHGGVGWLRLDR